MNNKNKNKQNKKKNINIKNKKKKNNSFSAHKQSDKKKKRTEKKRERRESDLRFKCADRLKNGKQKSVLGRCVSGERIRHATRQTWQPAHSSRARQLTVMLKKKKTEN